MPSAAERLHEAERSAAHLQQQLRDVEHSIAALSAKAAQQVEGANGPELGQQPPLPASLADCAAELALLSAGELYLKRLQVGALWQQLLMGTLVVPSRLQESRPGKDAGVF